MTNISNIVKDGNIVGYKIVGDSTNLLISEQQSRTKDLIEYIKSTGEYEFDFNGIKRIDGTPMDEVDFYSLDEVNKVMVTMEYSDAFPIESLVSQEKIETKQNEEIAEQLKGSEAIPKIKDKKLLIEYLQLPKIKGDIKLRYPLNAYLSNSAMFDYDTLRKPAELSKLTGNIVSSVGEYANLIEEHLTFTAEEWRGVLEVLQQNGHITENSSTVEILQAYFKFGYPGVNETFKNIQIIDKNNFYSGRSKSVQQQYLVDPITMETILPVQGLKATIPRMYYKPTTADEVNIGYIISEASTSAVLLQGERYDTLVTTDKVIIFRSSQRTPIMELPSIRVKLFNNMYVDSNELNLLNSKAVVNTLSKLCIDMVAETLSYEIRPREGKSTYDILQSCPMSIFAIVKYIMTEDFRAETRDLPAAEVEIKRAEYNDKVRMLDTVLQNYGDLINDEEMSESVGEVSQEVVLNYVNDIITGAIVVGETEAKTQEIKLKYYKIIKEYLLVAKIILGEDLQSIISSLIESIERVKEDKNPNKELEYEINVNDKKLKMVIDIDSNAILKANQRDYDLYTSRREAKIWMWCLEAFKEYGVTRNHIGMRYLMWKRSNQEGVLSQQALAAERAIYEEILNRLLESKEELVQQKGISRYILENTAEQLTATTLFNIARDNVKCEKILQETSYGNYVSYNITLNVNKLLKDAVITLPDTAYEYIKKNVKEHTDSLYAICSAAVLTTGIVRHIVNAEVTINKIIPKKGYTFVERDALGVCIHSSKVQMRELLRQYGHYNTPAGSHEPLIASLESSPNAINSEGGRLSEYGSECLKLYMKQKELMEQGLVPIKVLTMAEKTYPYFYPAVETRKANSPDELKPIQVQKPRMYTREIALAEQDAVKPKEIGITDKTISSGYLERFPLEVFKKFQLRDIGAFLIKDAINIISTDNNGILTELYDVYTTEAELLEHKIPFLKYEDNGKLVYILKGNGKLYAHIKEI